MPLPGPDGLQGAAAPIDLCDVCEGACTQPNVVYCDGPCRLGFHPACVGLDPARLDSDTGAEFLCAECTAGMLHGVSLWFCYVGSLCGSFVLMAFEEFCLLFVFLLEALLKFLIICKYF